MPFVNKEIDFDDFMKQLRQRLKKTADADALQFFDLFLEKSLSEELKHQAVADWNGRTVNAGDFDEIYPMAVEILHNAATRNASEAHPGIYEEASAVSLAFYRELNEFFQCSESDEFEFIPVKSYSQMMAEAGLVKLTKGPNGETMVSPIDDIKEQFGDYELLRDIIMSPSLDSNIGAFLF